jgi:hypothetical protein
MDGYRWPEQRWQRHSVSLVKGGGPEPSRDAKDTDEPYVPNTNSLGFTAPSIKKEEKEPLLWEGD